MKLPHTTAWSAQTKKHVAGPPSGLELNENCSHLSTDPDMPTLFFLRPFRLPASKRRTYSTRRHSSFVLLFVLWIVVVAVWPVWAQAQVTVTDLAGRSVRIPAKLERILLGEGRLLPALAILEQGDPSARLVGMMSDFEQLDAAGYAPWSKRFPHLDKVPRIGRSQAGTFSDERALQLRPQVAIFGLGGGHGPG